MQLGATDVNFIVSVSLNFTQPVVTDIQRLHNFVDMAGTFNLLQLTQSVAPL